MKVTLRQITALPTLMRWRAEVLAHVFGSPASPRVLVANRQYYRAHMADGSHLSFVADYGGEECGCGSVCLYDELPSPDNPSGHCAYLMNIYVRPRFRGRGIATTIVRRLVEEARTHGCGKIYLETTPEARPLYSSQGFGDMQNMMIYDTQP